MPLVPAAVAGTDRLLALGPLSIAFGAPIEIGRPASQPATCAAAAQEATERLMARIAELEATL